MSNELLDPAMLQALAALIASGAVTCPPTRSALMSMGMQMPERVLALISRLMQAGADRPLVAVFLHEMASELETVGFGARMSCVASGPRPLGGVRDTATVMEMLFSQASRHLLVVGYALHQGERVLRTVAERMEAVPELEVIFCMDVSRQFGDTSIADDVLSRWAAKFRDSQWPGRRLPAIYYDPRALLSAGCERASLHAKSIIADRQAALVTSANLTIAAQERNIEFGILVEDAGCARLMAAHFEALIRESHLRRLPI